MTIKHKPVTTESLEHHNTYYQVVVIPSCDRVTFTNSEGQPELVNYEVRNRKYDTVEWVGCNLPSALMVAEQLNDILVHKSWKEGVEELETDDFMYVDLTTKNKGSIQ